MKMKPPGLYANLRAKSARGEKMRKQGEEGAPSEKDFKNAAKTAKKKKGVKREDPKGNPAGYYDKEGCKTCAGGKKPCKCSKKDMVGRKSSYADGYGKKCDAVAADFESVLLRSDKKCGRSGIPEKAKCSKTTAAGRRPTKKRSFNPGLEMAKGFATTAVIAGGLGYVKRQQAHSASLKRSLKGVGRIKAKGNDKLVASLKSAKNLMASKNLAAFSGKSAMLEAQAKQGIIQGLQSRNIARAEAKSILGLIKNQAPQSAARRRKANRKPITAGLARR